MFCGENFLKKVFPAPLFKKNLFWEIKKEKGKRKGGNKNEGLAANRLQGERWL